MNQDYKDMMAEILAEKRGSIEGIEKQIAEKQSQNQGWVDRIDLSPAAALIDSLQGSNLSQTIGKGPTPYEQNQMVIGKLQQAMNKQKDGYADEALQFFKTGAYMDQVENNRARGEKNDNFDQWYKRQQLGLRRDAARAKKVAPAGASGKAFVGGKGIEAMDKAFGKTYEEQFLSGQLGAAEKNIENLVEVQKELSNRDDLTGGLVGNTPMMVRRRFFQDSASNQQKVEDVVQQSLKAILGAQFTEKEAARLIERAYDPALDESENAERVSKLYRALKRGVEAKKAAGRHFQKYKTMENFDGVTSFSVDGLISEIDNPTKDSPQGVPDFENLSDEELERMARGQ